MTDNDIIKALELVPHCNVYSGECKKCPYRWVDDCATRFPQDTLDLINRQKAENKELNHKYALAVAEREANVKGFTEQLSKIRAEAITEFAERLKAFNREHLIIYNEQIDQIAKEMKEGVGE